MGLPPIPETLSLSQFPSGKQSNESDWDGFAVFIALWRQLLLKKEKRRKRQLLTILGRSNLLCPRIPEVLGGPRAPAGNQDHTCSLGSVSNSAGSCRGELQGRCSRLNPRATLSFSSAFEHKTCSSAVAIHT